MPLPPAIRTIWAYNSSTYYLFIFVHVYVWFAFWCREKNKLSCFISKSGLCIGARKKTVRWVISYQVSIHISDLCFGMGKIMVINSWAILCPNSVCFRIIREGKKTGQFKCFTSKYVVCASYEKKVVCWVISCLNPVCVVKREYKKQVSSTVSRLNLVFVFRYRKKKVIWAISCLNLACVLVWEITAVVSCLLCCACCSIFLAVVGMVSMSGLCGICAEKGILCIAFLVSGDMSYSVFATRRQPIQIQREGAWSCVACLSC